MLYNINLSFTAVQPWHEHRDFLLIRGPIKIRID